MDLVVTIDEKIISNFDELVANLDMLYLLIGSAISRDTMIVREEAESALQFMIRFQLYLDQQNCKAKTNEKYTYIKEIVDKGINIIRRDMEDMEWL